MCVIKKCFKNKSKIMISKHKRLNIMSREKDENLQKSIFIIVLDF